MNRATTNHAAVHDRGLLDGLVIRRLAKCHRLLFRIVGEQMLRLHPVFVVSELAAIEPGALLEGDDAEAVAREFAGKHAA